MKVVYLSKNQEDTNKLGKLIATKLFPGSVLALDGDLGAGKTTFTQAIAKELGIKEHVSSPTFNILKCYFDGKLPLYHIDAYRLEDGINVDIGLEEVIEGNGVCIIEWGKFIEDKIYEPLNIHINILSSTEREFIIESTLDKYQSIIKNIEEELHENIIIR
jgi:tRNA threonylcarbamoyladenosine biosynthesis protein TsaE